jgi:hypothetical protein
MISFRSPVILLAGTLFVLSGVRDAVGDAPQTKAQAPPYSIPAGKVRVIARKVRADANAVQWRWTIVADDTWTGEKSDSFGNLTLLHGGGSSPSAPGAVSVFEHEITYSRGKHGDTPRFIIQVKTHQQGHAGSSGGGEDTDMKTLPPANQVTKALMTSDKLYSLPCRVPLMETKLFQPGGKPTGKTRTVYLEIKP